MNKLEKSQVKELAGTVKALALNLEDLISHYYPEAKGLQKYVKNCALRAKALEEKLQEEIEKE